jgi:signal peptidase I
LDQETEKGRHHRVQDRRYRPSVRQDTLYVKRIAALPGDTIGIDPPHILINGEPLAEPALFRQLAYGNDGQLARPTSSVTLAQDEYFALGDNTAPNMSLDSRHFGAITRKSIVGRISTIYWPVSRMGAAE